MMWSGAPAQFSQYPGVWGVIAGQHPVPPPGLAGVGCGDVYGWNHTDTTSTWEPRYNKTARKECSPKKVVSQAVPEKNRSTAPSRHEGTIASWNPHRQKKFGFIKHHAGGVGDIMFHLSELNQFHTRASDGGGQSSPRSSGSQLWVRPGAIVSYRIGVRTSDADGVQRRYAEDVSLVYKAEEAEHFPHEGTVTEYDPATGKGVIQDLKQYEVHFSFNPTKSNQEAEEFALENGRMPQVGDILSYKVRWGWRGRPNARDLRVVQRVDEKEDEWASAMEEDEEELVVEVMEKHVLASKSVVATSWVSTAASVAGEEHAGAGSATTASESEDGNLFQKLVGGKAVMEEGQSRIEGTISSWNPNAQKKYGFIKDHKGGKDIFFHSTDLPRTHDWVRPGALVSFLVGVRQGGRFAEKVELVQVAEEAGKKFQYGKVLKFDAKTGKGIIQDDKCYEVHFGRTSIPTTPELQALISSIQVGDIVKY